MSCHAIATHKKCFIIFYMYPRTTLIKKLCHNKFTMLIGTVFISLLLYRISHIDHVVQFDLFHYNFWPLLCMPCPLFYLIWKWGILKGLSHVIGELIPDCTYVRHTRFLFTQHGLILCLYNFQQSTFIVSRSHTQICCLCLLYKCLL